MTPAGCPDRQTLAALAAGLLSGEPLDAVAEHLDSCPACLALAQAVPADTEPVVDALCRPEPADPYAREAGCERAMDRLRALAEAGVTGDPSTVLGTEPSASFPADETGSGRYRPVRLHARGGLGEVHVALDEELSREVALKRIRRPRAGDPDSRRRFLREAEITARLEHPGVVPVYGLVQGDSGEPSYAMRFIQGETLESAIARFHAGDAGHDESDGHRLALRDFLGRFVAVCNAIAYAHSKGVLHRDLKPANIMLGAYGETLVVDWGLAKVVEAGGLGSVLGARETVAQVASDDNTQTGQALGTPAYMSPEQAAGQMKSVGPAADVYGLGATLYAILTGRPPLDGTTAEMLEQARQGNVPPPRTVKKDVPRPLDAVCRKAMARRPEDRYATPLALAADVERWLADEPVSAYREPPAARLARWGRRHKPWVVGAAALLLAAVVSLAGGLWAVNREREQTAAERDQKDAARRQARRAFNKLTDDTVERLMERLPQLTEADREFLRDMLAQHQEFATAAGDSPEARASIADALYHVGKIRYKLGENKDAEAAYRAARDIQQQLADAFPGQPDYHRNLASTLGGLGSLLYETARYEQATQTWRAARDIYQQLVTESPDQPLYRRGLAKSHTNVGVSLMKVGELSRPSEDALHASNTILRLLVSEFPRVPEYRSDLAQSHSNLGTLLGLTNRPREAEEAFRAAVALQLELSTELPSTAEHRSALFISQFNLSLQLQKMDRLPEAEEVCRAARALVIKFVADFPAVPKYRSQRVHFHLHHGDVFRAMIRPVETEEQYRAALEVAQKLADEFPLHSEYRHLLARSHYNIGEILYGVRQTEKAEQAYRDALAVFQRLADDFPDRKHGPNDLAVTLGRLAHLRNMSQDFTSARQLLERARPHHFADLKAEPKSQSSRLSFSVHLSRLAEAHLGLGDHVRAANTAEELSRFERDPATDHYKASGYTAQCVSVVLKDDRLTEARRQELARTYADGAMTLLHRAVQLGFKDATRLKEDTALDPLRGRDDFRKLLLELEAVAGGP